MELSFLSVLVIVLLSIILIGIPNAALLWDGRIRDCIKIHSKTYIIVGYDEEENMLLTEIWDLTNEIKLKTKVNENQLAIYFYDGSTHVRFKWKIYSFFVFYIRGVLHIWDAIRYFIKLCINK